MSNERMNAIILLKMRRRSTSYKFLLYELSDLCERKDC